MGFRVLYAPGTAATADTEGEELVDGTSPGDYARLITTNDRQALLRRLPAGHPADHGRPSVLLSHHEARTPVSGGVRTVDAVRQRPERPPHPDGDLRIARRPVRRAAPGADRKRAACGMASVARVLRRPRRGLHADRSRDPAAVRPAPRAPRVFADRDALLAAARDGPGRCVEPAARRSGARARHRDRDRRDCAGGGGLRRRGGSDHLVGRAILAAGAARRGRCASWCRSACCWACRCRRAFAC